MVENKLTKEDVIKLFEYTCISYLKRSGNILGVKHVLVGQSMIGSDKPAIMPVLTSDDTPDVKKIIERIIEEMGKQIMYKYILSFDVSDNLVKASIEEIGDGIIHQKIYRNTLTSRVEEFEDKSYQIFE